MNTALEKIYKFLSSYVELNINEEVRKIMLGNTSAMLEYQFGKGIKFDPEKVDKKDYERLMELSTILAEIQNLKLSIEDIKIKHSGYFGDFKLLSKYLILSNLNVKDCFSIILELIKHDIDNKGYISQDLENEISFISIEKFSSLSDDDRKNVLVYLNEIRYIDDEKMMKKVMNDNLKQVINSINVFEAFYLNKIESFNYEDLEKIVNSLIELGIDKELVVKIQTLLKKDIEKRNKEITLNNKVKIKSQSKMESHALTQFEYKSIRKELRKYFDFYNMKKIRELTEEEIIHCIELLLKIDTPLLEIQNFIRCFEISENEYIQKNIDLLNNNNAILLYIELYNKLKYYENKLCISDELKYIESCFEEMLICGDEDYIFYKKEIENELFKILNLIPQKYSYEMEMLQKKLSLK